MKVQYDDHPTHLKKLSDDPAHFDSFLYWNSEPWLNYWRLEKVVAPLFGFFRLHKDASWLTIGDGLYGQDANRIVRQGVRNVHASDMTGDLLAIGASKGYIPAFSAQNAESLSFGDASFDFLFCKDAYHHFPRPGIAIHEMLRVCRRAIVLVEPSDPMMSGNLLSWVKRLLGRHAHDFEDVGNYVYSLSRREVEKTMLGVGLRHCAFKTHEDCYGSGIEKVSVKGRTFHEIKVRLRYGAKRLLRAFLWRVRLIPANCLIAVLFKSEPTAEEIAVLARAGFTIRALPRNPYAAAPVS